MKKRYILWLLAILITISAAVYQRMTGPTYPLRGSILLDNQEIAYKLLRSHGGEGGQPVNLTLPDTTYKAFLFYKRYKTDDEWTKILMRRESDQLKAVLPHQPPAGKLEYYISLVRNGKEHTIPEKNSVVTRFKGDVPDDVLIPHILLMFLAMLMSNLTGLEALFRSERIFKYSFITCILLFIGGMILGPVVQKYAFGAFWSGFPFGYDLTDNKILFAMLGWIIALWQAWHNKSQKARWWVLAAAILLLLTYTIPHSTMGSELDYQTMEVVTG